MDDALSEPYFEVSSDLGATPPIVRASGELDAASSASFATAIDAALDAGGGLALDLGDVSFIDSSALRVVTVALRRALDAGQPFTISETSQAVRRIFDMTGVSALLAP